MTARLPTELARARGSVVIGMKSAALELWGPDAVASLARSLSTEARVAIFDDLLLPMGWIAESSVIEFWRAAYEGPLEAREGALVKYVESAVMHGWGRFRKVFVGLMTPALLTERAPALWRHDHTHGVVEATMLGNTGVVRLIGHEYGASPVACRFMAASFQAIVAMSRAKDVTSVYSVDERRTLTVRLAWK